MGSKSKSKIKGMMMEELRAYLEPVLEEQSEHPVWGRLRVVWERSVLADGGNQQGKLLVTTDGGTGLQWMTPAEVVEAKQARETRIKLAEEDPLRHPWEHDMWRRIDLAMARKRLEHPGKVLELLVTGGMRPGKTEGTHRRATANFLYTRKSWVWGLHETDVTSRTIQQKRVEKFLPVELKPESGKMKKDRNTKFTFSEGTGFTGAMFHLTWRCRDENAVEFEGGGEFDFRFYKQDESTFHGAELTCAVSDELIPLTLAKIVVQRMSTRAMDTVRPEFLLRIRRAVGMLERGEPLPVALLGAIYHGVHLLGFTPAEGWTSTVNHFLNGAEKFDREVSPDLIDKPGVQDATVPRFAQPVDPTKLVAYLFTSDNLVKPAYPTLRESVRNAPESQVRIILHGDVDKDWQTRFHSFNTARHVKTWAEVPSEGTVYEVIDPAGAKPWVLAWFLCDVAGRHWQLQEWPCPSIPIDGSSSGPWAVVSEGEKRNGDAGPAQKLRLNYTRAHWTRIIWMMRQRLFKKLTDVHGSKLKVRSGKKTLEWEGRPEWKLEGDFVIPAETTMDSRYSQVRVEAKGFSTTLLEAMMDEENGVPMGPAPGDAIYEGDQFIQQAMADDLLGLPGLMVLKECENTRFMFATYCVPEHKEDTKATDEACKDYRDPWAYYLLSDPRHLAAREAAPGEGEGW